MAIEIERKFLVRSEDWRNHVVRTTRIRQAYLASGERTSTRVRIKDDTHASVAIKSKKTDVRRLEVEYPISVFDAEALMALRVSEVVETVRHEVPAGRHVWEIDVFAGRNSGLVIAEIEVGEIGEAFAHPAWLGREVTGQAPYYNGSLSRHPYLDWDTAQRVAATA